jgi:hypothetical protein
MIMKELCATPVFRGWLNGGSLQGRSQWPTTSDKQGNEAVSIRIVIHTNKTSKPLQLSNGFVRLDTAIARHAIGPLGICLVFKFPLHAWVALGGPTQAHHPAQNLGKIIVKHSSQPPQPPSTKNILG